MSNYIIVSYFTLDTYYQGLAPRLLRSLRSQKLSYDIVGVPNLGSWQANTHYKPYFILQMMKKHKGKAIVYMDVDAVVVRSPDLFASLSCDIGVPVLDHAKYGRSKRGKEILSGTLFFNNSPSSQALVEEWIKACPDNPGIWEQKILQALLEKKPYSILPDEYCHIFDYGYGNKIGLPVITHYQASRQFRRTKSLK